MQQEYRARIEAARPQLVALARERYGLELNIGPFGIDSRPALVGAKFAEAHNVGEAYHAAVFRAYWQQGQNVAETAVLAQVAAQIGLAKEAFLAALDGVEWQQAVDADIAQARQYGLTAVPALVFGNHYLVSGAQPYEILVQVTEQCAAEQRLRGK